MSQVEATEKLLKLNPGHPLKTGEILDAFRRSGMQLNPKNASTILYTSLKRNGNFERVAGQAWGLSEWYPDKRKRRDQPESSENRESEA
jgi:DNA-directed RNA polymerase delta subunit